MHEAAIPRKVRFVSGKRRFRFAGGNLPFEGCHRHDQSSDYKLSAIARHG